MELRHGMRVKVVKVPPYEFDYRTLVGKFGTVSGEPWEEWVYVIIDGEKLGTEFRVEEVEPINVRIIEGECEIDGDADGLTMVTIDNEDVYNFLWVTGCDSKRVRLTLEVLEDAPS